MKYFFSALILTLFLLGALPTSAQNDCNELEDPLVGYNPLSNFDPCCFYYPDQSVCYDFSDFVLTYGMPPYHFYSIEILDSVYVLDVDVDSFPLLAQHLNTLSGLFDIDAEFVYNPSDTTICATDISSIEFGDLTFCFTGTLFLPSGNPCIYTVPAITEQDCPFESPLTPPILDLSNTSVSNTTLIDQGSAQLTSDDMLNAGPFSSDPNYSGPSMQDATYFFTSMITSGLLPNGAGCPNVNCIDLTAVAGELTSDPTLAAVLDSIGDANNDINNEIGNTPLSEWLEDEIGDYLDDMNTNHGSFAGFINDMLGWNFPDQPCEGSDIYGPGFDSGSAEKNKKILKKGNHSNQNPLEKGLIDPPSISADQNYFKDVIAGLGLEGPGAVMPSPSSLSMIEQVNAGVNLYNGSQSTAIPLYTLNANGISLPVSVSSGNNGLKVNDLGTLLGQNWDLNAGGMISRVVKGLPDEFNGYLDGKGMGRSYLANFHMEIPSNVDLSLTFAGQGGPSSSNMEESIRDGFFGEKIPIAGDNIFLIPRWTPLRPTVITFTIYFKIPLGAVDGPIDLHIGLGVNIGFGLNETLAKVSYEEHGIGFFHIDSTALMDTFFNLPALNNPNYLTGQLDDVQRKYLEKIHNSRKFEDSKFFNDQVSDWDALIQALNNLFSNGKTYKSNRIDTEPDEFYFDIGSHSGKFQIKPNGDVILFPLQDLSVSYQYDISGQHLASFTIRTGAGMEYVFGNASTMEAVDLMRNVNYHLPNFYTYPELDTSNNHLDTAVIDMAKTLYQGIIGPKRELLHGNTYNRHYKIMDSPIFTSAWHLVEVRSLLSTEKVELEYTKRENLTYYSDKSYQHVLPNFEVSSQALVYKETNDFNPIEVRPTKWEAGRAEFNYSVTQTILNRYDLVRIKTQAERAEDIYFYYERPRVAILGDSLCSRIEVHRNGSIYRGWIFDYEEPEVVESTANCAVDETYGWTAAPSPISIGGEEVFDLGKAYEHKFFEYYTYFHFLIKISNILTVPIRIHFDKSNDNFEDFGYRTQMSEFGSLMEVKALEGEYDEDLEEAMFNAEKKRSFLKEIRELDKNYDPGSLSSTSHSFVTISYAGSLEDLPKRFSPNQDLFGYFNDNNGNRSPLPSVHYQTLEGDTVNTETAGIGRHFGFKNLLANDPGTIYQGQNEAADLAKAKVGAVEEVRLATGGRIGFSYGLNKLPNGSFGAGLRVIQRIERPDSSTLLPKVTNYSYKGETTISDPIRIRQIAYDFFYQNPGEGETYEQRIVCSSSPLNPIFSNKSSHVGYGRVTESWDGLGRVEHFFTTPTNCDSIIKELPLGVYYDTTIWHQKKRAPIYNGSWDSFTENALILLPPELKHPQSAATQNYPLGIEYNTKIYDALSTLVQQTESRFSCVDDVPSSNELFYFKSVLYQNNFPGTFFQNYFYRQIENYKPFQITVGSSGTEMVISELINYVIDLIYGIAVPHPYKRIDRTYVVTNFRNTSGSVVLDTTITYNYYGADTNWVQTNFTYSNDLNPWVADSTFVTYSDGLATLSTNYFLSPDSFPEHGYFTQSALNHLGDIEYHQPLYSKSYLFGNLVSVGLSGLAKIDGRIVPTSNWTARNGSVQLVGKFTDWDSSHGKPTVYRLAKYGTQNTDPVNSTNYFEPINLSWNDQLQLESRTYQGFGTSYFYNSYFELLATIDPDTIYSSYTYDARGRLKTATVLNGTQTQSYTYNIEPENNFVQTTISFEDGENPEQITTQYVDGFGKALSTVRENDGAVLSSANYDQFFRPVVGYQIGRGPSLISYEASPLNRETTTTDAVGNTTTTLVRGDANFFQATEITDPNGSVNISYADGLGRTKRILSDLGAKTDYFYDGYSRLSKIINPIEEEYNYSYNDIDQLIQKEVPVAGQQEIWWDENYRPIATRDAKGQVRLFVYDEHNRIEHIRTPAMGTNFSTTDSIYLDGAFDGINGDTLLVNRYEAGHTWLEQSRERILISGGFGDYKTTLHGRDELGRSIAILETYPAGTVHLDITYVDAGLVTDQSTTVNGPQTISSNYTFTFDELLRPEETSLQVNSSPLTMISMLEYNSQDQVKTKFLGEISTGGFLQKVDYFYDPAGKLVAINSPGEMDCFVGQQICTLEATFTIANEDGDDQGQSTCKILTAIEVDGQVYTLGNPYNLLSFSGSVADSIALVLEYYGYFGTPYEESSPLEEVYSFTIGVTNTNAPSIALHFQGCQNPVELDVQECCVGQEPGSESNPATAQNPDLFYEELTYGGLNVNRIELGSDCTAGMMRNDYSYDGDHRITAMHNTFFNPQPIIGSYNTSYAYDPAGNITNLVRYGLTDNTGGTPTFGLIDSLEYSYFGGPEGSSRLDTILDVNSGPNQSLGFEVSQALYAYDANGNQTADGEQGLTIEYNLLNLPEKVEKSSISYVEFDYTYGGQKIRKNPVGNGEGTRLYLGGIEFLDSLAESFYHPEGRIVLDSLRFQYKISDHLGNTVVLFEDRDGDGVLKSELDTSDPASLEVWQRSYYYPFGMPMEGTWQDTTTPRMDYLYNGKEVEEELDLDWLAYGFRYYDPVIGRFSGVDPLASDFAAWSIFSYTLNRPIILIDPDGREPYPPVEGIPQYSDDDGLFFWNESKQSYDHHMIMPNGNTAYFDQYHVTSDSRSSGEANYIFNGQYGIDGGFTLTPDRPDYDGFVTINEGIQWVKDHPLTEEDFDNTLYIAAAKLDFGELSVDDFTEIGEPELQNLLYLGAPNDVIYTYGNVKITLLDKEGNVTVGKDFYDWDYHDLNRSKNKFKTSIRNTLVWFERFRAGVGGEHGAKIVTYGVGKLNPK